MRYQRLIKWIALPAVLAFLVTMTSFCSFADGSDGNSSGGGGDLIKISKNELSQSKEVIWLRASWVNQYLRDETQGLKANLIAVIQKMNRRDIEMGTVDLPEKFKSIREVLLSHRDLLIQDIQHTRYIPSEERVIPWCGKKDGQEKDAATCGELNSDVKFNLHRLAKYKVSRNILRWRLIELAFHEHVRHLGYADNENILARVSGFIFLLPDALELAAKKQLDELLSKQKLAGGPNEQEKLVNFTCNAIGYEGLLAVAGQLLPDPIETPYEFYVACGSLVENIVQTTDIQHGSAINFQKRLGLTEVDSASNFILQMATHEHLFGY